MAQKTEKTESGIPMFCEIPGWRIYCGNPLDFERMYRDNPEEFERQLAEFRTGLSEQSCEYLDKYINRVLALPTSVGNHIPLLIPDSVDFFTDAEKIVLANREFILNTLYREYSGHYDLSGIDFSLHVFYYECGIMFLPDRIKNAFLGKIAVDCGAYNGDSVLMLANYGFSRITAFEAIPQIYELLRKNISCNHLEDRVECVNAAVGETNKNLNMTYREGGGSSVIDIDVGIEVKMRKLDTHFRRNATDVGLIKMDIEGLEEAALRGAVEVIRKARPVLLLSVYHHWIAPGQMFQIKKFIESLNLGYRFIFRASQPDVNLITEYILIAYAE